MAEALEGPLVSSSRPSILGLAPRGLSSRKWANQRLCFSHTLDSWRRNCPALPIPLWARGRNCRGLVRNDPATEDREGNHSKQIEANKGKNTSAAAPPPRANGDIVRRANTPKYRQHVFEPRAPTRPHLTSPHSRASDPVPGERPETGPRRSPCFAPDGDPTNSTRSDDRWLTWGFVPDANPPLEPHLPSHLHLHLLHEASGGARVPSTHFSPSRDFFWSTTEPNPGLSSFPLLPIHTLHLDFPTAPPDDRLPQDGS